jgi:glycerophosphoryl diester phosphodiesterase
MRLILVAALLGLAGCASMPERAAEPIVIAHRGASGLRPEHTLEAYSLAIQQGANFIEPDLVMTRDGVLVARHENEIGETTDVANRPEFAQRRATKTIDGRAVTGWFTEDLTLAELKTLRARERLPPLRPGNTAYDGRFKVPTFEEVIALAKRAGVGIYPELKHPTYFASVGLPMEDALLGALRDASWTRKTDPVFVQCFEVGPLERLRGRTGVRLIQLVADEGGPADKPELSYRDMVTPAGLAAIARYADGIGPAKALIVPRGPDGRSLPPTSLVADAHAAGLKVHPWTFRSENFFLPAELRRGDDPRAHGDVAAEYRLFFGLGVDGVFSDHPADAVAAIENSSPRT